MGTFDKTKSWGSRFNYIRQERNFDRPLFDTESTVVDTMLVSYIC